MLRKGLEIYTDAVDLHYLLAQSWLSDPAGIKDGEVVEPARGYAIAELRAVLGVVKTHAPAMNNLAWLLSGAEATRPEAIELAEKMVRMYPNYAPYLDTQGVALMRHGRAGDAVKAFRQALGACETERAAIDKMTSRKLSAAESARADVLRRRLERTLGEVKAHYDEALKVTSPR
jgi:tetratricopeptide (TPR) repeat protein